MAVMQHSIIFGGVDSADYGIYIGGEGTFNAPQRDVEMISIPGRNGAFALDLGRFENIEVTYTAINQEPDLSTFSQKLDAFRNAICSQRGYQRLEDTFHTDEYRMATYIGGLEINPIEYNTASQFDITFNCKPQRFLTSGETEISVSSGDTITNPTLFEASPLLKVRGHGTITVGDGAVAVNPTVGKITIASAYRGEAIAEQLDKTFPIETTEYNTGDAIIISGIKKTATFKLPSGEVPKSASFESFSTGASGAASCTANSITYTLKAPSVQFTAGTAQEITVSGQLVYTYTQGGTTGEGRSAISIKFNYYTEGSPYLRVRTNSLFNGETSTTSINEIYIDSTAFYAGDIYVDLDIGEAYIIENSERVSVNSMANLPAILPTLATGETAVTYENTVTELGVTPRWWKV